jgi:sRNA-binding carbon storage regulator CsrA
MVMMNWATLAMKRACESVIVEQEIEIAEMVFLGVNAPAETNIDLAEVSDEVCIEVTSACAESTRKGTGDKKRKISGFVHAARGKRSVDDGTRGAALEAAEVTRVEKLERASTANAAARGVRCPLCVLLVEDLWAKVPFSTFIDKLPLCSGGFSTKLQIH